MNDLPEHELLSAHLDGELTAAEEACVGQFLSENPAARQLLDDLRNVSVTVQALPELRLGEDLSGHVLRQAERAILTGPGKPSIPEPASPPPTRRWQELFRRAVTSRGVAWSGAALAIALLIMLSSSPERQRERDVALAPKPPARDAVATAEAEQQDVAEVAELWAADEARDDRLGVEADPETKSARKEAVTREALNRAAAPAPAAALPPSERPVALPPPPKPELAAPRMAPAMPLDMAEEPPDVPRQPAKPGQLAVEEAEARDNAMAAGELERREAGIPADSPVLLVHCDITPEAAREGAFDQILASQQIVLHDDQAQARRAGRFARSQDADREVGELPGRAKRQLADFDARERHSDGAFDVVLVEATPGQVAATLDQLAQLPDQFLAVSVKPAPGVASQQDLRRFSRAAPPAGRGLEEPKQRLRAAAMPDGQPKPAEEAKATEAAEKQVDKMEQRLSSQAGEGAVPPGRVGSAPMAGRGPQRFGNGRAGYGGAGSLQLGAPQADAVASGRVNGDAKGLAPPESESEPADQYRVLFVLRVVSPDLMTAPAASSIAPAAPSAPAADIDGAAAEPAPAAEAKDDNG
ncbi:MAG: hypothetical protein RBS80_08230 [Thermoguttaceae bacterium]|jgi:hypothetical protein|nr:hypothetical protein [Thermoguttaceae bacterium]